MIPLETRRGVLVAHQLGNNLAAAVWNQAMDLRGACLGLTRGATFALRVEVEPFRPVNAYHFAYRPDRRGD